VEIKDGIAYLPCDPSQVIENLQREAYAANRGRWLPDTALARIYHFCRPMLPVPIRRHFQKFQFRGRSKLKSLRWPVDCAVDNIHAQLLSLSLKASGLERIPFIWFWPKGAASCAILTHEIETELGGGLCGTLMDINDLFGIKASFLVSSHQCCNLTPEFLSSSRNRGYEVLVQELDHDRHRNKDRKGILAQPARINSYASAYGAEEFQSARLCQEQSWNYAAGFSYGISVPNIAHLGPQPCGCCTVMPSFLGDILELPVTTTQDHVLFDILEDYSIDLWKQQMETIMEKHGLISFIMHSSQIRKPQPRSIYEALLGYLSCLEEERNLWITTPSEANRWWRQRAEMKLVHRADGWHIEGLGAERARLAYAELELEQLVYRIEGDPEWKARAT